jgi:hypothetical protein
LNEKGETISQEFFKKGIPEGTHTFNFPNAKPKHITVYEKGEIVEETEFEELTGAKHVIKERVDKKAEKEKAKAAKNAVATDDDPDLIKSEPTKHIISIFSAPPTPYLMASKAIRIKRQAISSRSRIVNRASF